MLSFEFIINYNTLYTLLLLYDYSIILGRTKVSLLFDYVQKMAMQCSKTINNIINIPVKNVYRI